MKAEVIRHSADLERLRPVWNPLLRQSRGDTVFLTWEWCQTWLQTAGRYWEPFVIVVQDSTGTVRGIAPLYRCEASLVGFVPYRWLCVLGDRGSGSEYPDLLLDFGAERQVLTAIRDCLREHATHWDCLWLPRLAEWTGAIERWSAGCEGCTVKSRPREFSAIELPGSLEAYRRGLSSNMRSNLKRQENGIGRQARIKFTVFRSGGDILDRLDDFVRLHQQRRAHAGEDSAFSRNPDLQKFYVALCREMHSAGWLHLFQLELDNRIAALQFGLAYSDTFHQLQEGCDPTVPGVGNLLRLRAIEACIQEGLRRYDFLGGFSEHKRRWGAKARPGCDLFVHQRSLRTIPLRAAGIWPTGRFATIAEPRGGDARSNPAATGGPRDAGALVEPVVSFPQPLGGNERGP